LNLKEKKKPFLFLNLLGTVAKVLTMRCFSGGYEVGSYKKEKDFFFSFRLLGCGG
jgi:hypothetical protein